MPRTFSEMLCENGSAVVALTKEQMQQLADETSDTASFVAFFEKHNDFPGAGMLNSFIGFLQIYNGKLFDNWIDHVALRFEKADIGDGRYALLFTVAVDKDSIGIDTNVMYRRWWKSLKAERPRLVYYLSTEKQGQPTGDELYKVVNKKTLQRDRKEKLAKSAQEIINKSLKVRSERKPDAGSAIDQPEKDVDYVIGKREQRKRSQA